MCPVWLLVGHEDSLGGFRIDTPMLLDQLQIVHC